MARSPCLSLTAATTRTGTRTRSRSSRGLSLLGLGLCWLLALISLLHRTHAQVSLASTPQFPSPPTNFTIADDQQALVDLFASTGGRASNTTTGWRRSTRWLTFNHTHPSRGVCLWFGVQCGPPACLLPANASWTPPPCRVTEIALIVNNLVGTLPASLGRLDALETLNLFRNQLRYAGHMNRSSAAKPLRMCQSPRLFAGHKKLFKFKSVAEYFHNVCWPANACG